MDVERIMQFILDQQAKFSSGMNELRGLVGQIGAAVEQIPRQQLDLTQHVDQFQREISAAMLAIAQEQQRLAEGHRRHQEEIKEIREIQRHNDEALGALMRIVDDLIRGQRPQ